MSELYRMCVRRTEGASGREVRTDQGGFIPVWIRRYVLEGYVWQWKDHPCICEAKRCEAVGRRWKWVHWHLRSVCGILSGAHPGCGSGRGLWAGKDDDACGRYADRSKGGVCKRAGRHCAAWHGSGDSFRNRRKRGCGAGAPDCGIPYPPAPAWDYFLLRRLPWQDVRRAFGNALCLLPGESARCKKRYCQDSVPVLLPLFLWKGISLLRYVLPQSVPGNVSDAGVRAVRPQYKDKPDFYADRRAGAIPRRRSVCPQGIL